MSEIKGPKRPHNAEPLPENLKRKKTEDWTEFQGLLDVSMLLKCLCKHSLPGLIIHLGKH